MVEQRSAAEAGSREHPSRTRKQPKNLLAELEQEATKKRVTKQNPTPETKKAPSSQPTPNSKARGSESSKPGPPNAPPDMPESSTGRRRETPPTGKAAKAGRKTSATKAKISKKKSPSRRKAPSNRVGESKKKSSALAQTLTIRGSEETVDPAAQESASFAENTSASQPTDLAARADEHHGKNFWDTQVALSGFVGLHLDDIPAEYQQQYPMMTFLNTHPAIMDVFAAYRREFSGVPVPEPTPTATDPNQTGGTASGDRTQTSQQTRTWTIERMLENDTPEQPAFEQRLLRDIEAQALIWWQVTRQEYRNDIDWVETEQYGLNWSWPDFGIGSEYFVPRPPNAVETGSGEEMDWDADSDGAHEDNDSVYE